MKIFRHMGSVNLWFYQLLLCTHYATATPAPSTDYKDIYLEAPGSDIDITIPLLERSSDSVRTYVKVTPSVEERIAKSDSKADKRFFLFKNHPRPPPHPPTRHRPPIHPPRPFHGPLKHPPKPYHGPPLKPYHGPPPKPHGPPPKPHGPPSKHHGHPSKPFEYHSHFDHIDHGSNNIFEPAHGFDFEPPYFMNEESEFPYMEDFFDDQYFNPDPPKPDSFTFPSGEHDGHDPDHYPHVPEHDSEHYPHIPDHDSDHYSHIPDHVNFITEENIYRGDVPFKETHNDRDMIHPGLTPAGVKGLDPGLVAFISDSARPFLE